MATFSDGLRREPYGATQFTPTNRRIMLIWVSPIGAGEPHQPVGLPMPIDHLAQPVGTGILPKHEEAMENSRKSLGKFPVSPLQAHNAKLPLLRKYVLRVAPGIVPSPYLWRK